MPAVVLAIWERMSALLGNDARRTESFILRACDAHVRASAPCHV